MNSPFSNDCGACAVDVRNFPFVDLFQNTFLFRCFFFPLNTFPPFSEYFMPNSHSTESVIYLFESLWRWEC